MLGWVCAPCCATRTPGAVPTHPCCTLCWAQMADLPLDPIMARMLLAAGQMGCTEEVVTVVAMLRCARLFSV